MHSRIDATEETNRLGRLIGHKHTQDSPNLVSKCVMENGIPRLLFLAARNIKSGEELLYDYGDREKSTVQELPWLLPADDQPNTVLKTPTRTFQTKERTRKNLFERKQVRSLFKVVQSDQNSGTQTDLSLTGISDTFHEELQLHSQSMSEPQTPGNQSQSIPMTPATPATPLVYRSAIELVSGMPLHKDLLKDKKYYVLGKIQTETTDLLKIAGAKKHHHLSDLAHYIILGENPDLEELDMAYENILIF